VRRTGTGEKTGGEQVETVTTNDEENTRQAKREKKLRKKKEKITQHGKNLSKIYVNAIKKRTGKKGK